MSVRLPRAEVQVLVASAYEADHDQVSGLLKGLVNRQTAYSVDWHRTGADAAQALENGTFDVCIVGRRLSDGSAAAFIGDWAKTDRAAPIIHLHGGELGAVAQAKAAGADDCLSKEALTCQLLETVIGYAIERRQLRRRLDQLAEFDPLTKLPNRNAFERRLEEALANAERTGKHVAVLFVDLDNFKNVNEALGHRTGDKLLQRVAGRLLKAKRKTDIVARMGGDEFAMLAVNLDRASAATPLARRVLGGLQAPFELDGKVVHSGASVGITTFPTDARNAKAMLVNADLALHRAKAMAPHSYFFFDSEMQRNVQRRSKLEADLRRAVDNGELTLHFQPQIDLRERAVSGAEALVRWEHPELGMVSPVAFIPIAEATGLIGALGDQVLQKACAACARWRQTLSAHLRISVNLSPNQFQADDLSDRVLKTVSEHGIEPGQLELEITEETMMRNVDRAINDLQTLRASGVQLAIDDFGTGYSSLNYLKRLPVHHLKIDRSFIGGVDQNPADRAIVGSIIGMCHALGMGVVAEGVERETQLAFLQSQSCNEVQGFLFSPALENSAFENWVRGFNQSLDAAGGRATAKSDASPDDPAAILVQQDPGLPRQRRRRPG